MTARNRRSGVEDRWKRRDGSDSANAGQVTRWRARYVGPDGRERTKHFTRKVDAQRWLDEVTASVVTGLYVDPKAGRISFGQYAKDWSARQVWVPGTMVSFNGSMRQVTFAGQRIGDIRRSHVEAWVKELSTTLKPSTVKLRYDHAAMVFRAAVRDKIIATDPSIGVVLPRRRRRDAAMVIPSPAEVKHLIETADGQFRVFLQLCAYAGLRRGEAAGLQFGDIDFLRRTLHVQRQVQRDGVRDPKFGSERQIAIPDELVVILSEHVRGGVHRDGWLFIGERGPVGDNWAAHKLSITRKAAGLGHITLHSLRHFYVSGLIAAGCDVVTVQRAVGHSSATTTLATYSHLWPTAEDRTRNAAAGIMAQVAAESLRNPGGDRAAD